MSTNRGYLASRNAQRTRGGSPIYYDPIMANVSGKGDSFRIDHRPKAVVKARDGTRYHIPYSKRTGKVPVDVMFERFIDEDSGVPPGQGRRSVPKDLSQTASKTHTMPKGGFTPEEIVGTGWWQYPGSCDIEGIDDPRSFYMGPWAGTKGGRREASTRIAVIGDEDEADLIRRTLIDNFTAAELKKATRDGGLVVTMGDPGRGSAGCYYARQPGIDTPKIVIRPGYDERFTEDTITHEMTHHLRATDDRRKGLTKYAFPQTEDGEKDLVAYSLMTDRERATIRSMEEAATVAETTARTRRASRPSGYYQDIKGQGRDYETANRLYEEDRQLMMRGFRRDGPARGKQAINRVEDRFEDTHISGLRVSSKGQTAKEGYASAGQLRSKPAKKASKKTTPASSASKAPAKKQTPKKSTSKPKADQSKATPKKSGTKPKANASKPAQKRQTARKG